MAAPLLLYTDGSCSGNPGPGGWGALCIYPVNATTTTVEASGGSPFTTNNQMELEAAIRGLEDMVPEGAAVTLYSDSKYVIMGMTAWVDGWMKRGWVSSTGRPVANQERWERLWAASMVREVTWVWVKGHATNAHNNRCDILAKQMTERYKNHG